MHRDYSRPGTCPDKPAMCARHTYDCSHLVNTVGRGRYIGLGPLPAIPLGCSARKHLQIGPLKRTAYRRRHRSHPIAATATRRKADTFIA
eukprot:scaffold38882_cov320-Isochrysis_galbana.AAC.2